jgi:hypothetical protein
MGLKLEKPEPDHRPVLQQRIAEGEKESKQADQERLEATPLHGGVASPLSF